MTDKESLTSIEHDVQIEERTKYAMETYVNWLQTAMSASPWSNVDLNKRLLNYATENVTAAVGLVEELSHAKNLEDVVKIQTEFVSKQLGSLSDQTKTIMEICTKAAQEATPFPKLKLDIAGQSENGSDSSIRRDRDEVRHKI